MCKFTASPLDTRTTHPTPWWEEVAPYQYNYNVDLYMSYGESDSIFNGGQGGRIAEDADNVSIFVSGESTPKEKIFGKFWDEV